MKPQFAQTCWPTDEQLERFGAERCSHDGCTTWINPHERRRRLCLTHERQARRDRFAGRDPRSRPLKGRER